MEKNSMFFWIFCKKVGFLPWKYEKCKKMRIFSKKVEKWHFMVFLVFLGICWLNFNVFSFPSFNNCLPSFVHTNLTRRIHPRYPETPISKTRFSLFPIFYRYVQLCLPIFRFVQRQIWKTENPRKGPEPVPRAQVGQGPKWAKGPSGPRAQVGPLAQVGQGPKWAKGPSGSRAQVGPGPKWAQGPWDRAGSRAHDLLGEHLTKRCTLKIEAMLLIFEAILLMFDVFMKTNKMRTDITRRMVAVSRRDLHSEAQSWRKH